MDARNTFETPQTARLARLEWGGLLVLCAVLLLVHLDEIDWPSFVALFVVIDLIGYIPGAIAYRRRANHVLPKAYYVLYNTMLTDMETCYKVMRREVLEGLDLRSRGFGVEPELTAKIFKRGYRVYEVPITYDGRGYEEGKKITWKDGLTALWVLIRHRLG